MWCSETVLGCGCRSDLDGLAAEPDHHPSMHVHPLRNDLHEA